MKKLKQIRSLRRDAREGDLVVLHSEQQSKCVGYYFPIRGYKAPDKSLPVNALIKPLSNHFEGLELSIQIDFHMYFAGYGYPVYAGDQLQHRFYATNYEILRRKKENEKTRST